MIDNELLKEVINYNKYKRYHFNHFIQWEENKQFDKILNARYHKVSRIKKRFRYLFENKTYFYFLTFTFDNKYIDKCERTKKDLIKHCLLEFDKDYYVILNKDFGKKNEREHYHAILGTDSSDNLLEFLNKNYPCRFHVERILFKGKDFSKLSKYINKLQNHCVKDTTLKTRIYFKIK